MIKRPRVNVWQQSRGTGFVSQSKTRAGGNVNFVSKCVMQTSPKKRKELLMVKNSLHPRVQHSTAMF